MRRLTIVALSALLAGCGGPKLETRTFELHYLTSSAAEDVIEPYVYEDRPDAPGKVQTAGRLITVRETSDNLDRIARVLEQFDKPSVNLRLGFQIIRADGAGPVDTSIAAIEAQLRRLFRFRGYQLIAQTSTVAAHSSSFRVVTGSGENTYMIEGEVEDASVSGDSGYARLKITLYAPRYGNVLNTAMNVRLGHTAVLGGQPLGQEGALVLAVRATPEVSP